MPGAARQRGRAILARLALKLRAVSGLSDVALDLPGEPAPAPAAGAALADFRRRVAAAAAQAAPSQADFLTRSAHFFRLGAPTFFD